MRRVVLLSGAAALCLAGGMWFQHRSDAHRKSQGHISVPTAKPEPVALPLTAGTEHRQRRSETLPQVFQRAVQEPQWRPKPHEIPVMDQDEETILIERFRAIPGLTNKIAIALVLGYGGGEDSVAVLANTLTNAYAGRQFSQGETSSFLGLLQALGYASQRHETARRFLEAACEPGFWDRAALPDCADAAGFRRRLLDHSLIGLALSDSEEALRLFEGIRAGALPGWPEEHRSAVTDAVFRYRMLEQHGTKYLSGEAFPSFESFMKAFREWRGSEEGRQWSAWSSPTAQRDNHAK